MCCWAGSRAQDAGDCCQPDEDSTNQSQTGQISGSNMSGDKCANNAWLIVEGRESYSVCRWADTLCIHVLMPSCHVLVSQCLGFQHRVRFPCVCSGQPTKQPTTLADCILLFSFNTSLVDIVLVEERIRSFLWLATSVHDVSIALEETERRVYPATSASVSNHINGFLVAPACDNLQATAHHHEPLGLQRRSLRRRGNCSVRIRRLPPCAARRPLQERTVQDCAQARLGRVLNHLAHSWPDRRVICRNQDLRIGPEG